MKHIIVIGAGIAGIEAASALTEAGHWVTVIEKGAQVGGKLNNWSYPIP